MAHGLCANTKNTTNECFKGHCLWPLATKTLFFASWSKYARNESTDTERRWLASHWKLRTLLFHARQLHTPFSRGVIVIEGSVLNEVRGVHYHARGLLDD